MRIIPRTVSALATLAALTLLAAGCASAPGSPVPTSTGTPADGSVPSSEGKLNEVDMVWLDGGRSFAVVTWGSSSCSPVLGDVAASGQSIRVTLAASAEKACTDDLAPRPLLVAVPEGVDVTAEVEVEVLYGARTETAQLPALAQAPEDAGEQKPSAGWFDEEGIALLTWGSSSCAPIVDEVQPTETGASVVFSDDERMCTMDYAPRVTAIRVPEGTYDKSAPFTLELTGGGLDGPVAVER